MKINWNLMEAVRLLLERKIFAYEGKNNIDEISYSLIFKQALMPVLLPIITDCCPSIGVYEIQQVMENHQNDNIFSFYGGQNN